MQNRLKGILATGTATTALVFSSAALAQIPPHGSFQVDHEYTVELPSPELSEYDSSPPRILIEANFFPTQHPSQNVPFTQEIIEFSIDGDPVTTYIVDDPFPPHGTMGCDSQGSNTYRLIHCPFVHVDMHMWQANEPSVELTARYYAVKAGSNGGADIISYGTNTVTVNCQPGRCGPQPLCNAEGNPIMPGTVANDGTFVFDFAQGQVCPTRFWIDPPIATGYDYTVSGAKFTSVTAPSLASVNDPDGYFLQFPGQGIPAVQLQAGQTHTLPQQVSAFQIAGIDPALQLDPSDQAAFRLGIELSTPTGAVQITQKPRTNQPPPPPAPKLFGTDVTIMSMNNPAHSYTKTANNSVEFPDYGVIPFGPNGVSKRWDIDIQSDTIRIDFDHAHGAASYGNGMVLNFTNLKPNISNCSGPGIVTGTTTTTSKSDAPYTVSGTSFSDDRVNIALAPPSGVYNWSTSDWIETKLSFGCAGQQMQQQGNGNANTTVPVQQKPRDIRGRLERRLRGVLGGSRPTKKED